MLKKPKIGRGAKIGRGVELGNNVEIGAGCVISQNAVIYDGVRLGADSFVGPGCVLGERTRNYYSNPRKYRAGLCCVGRKSILRAGTILYADMQAGDFFETGPYVTIREKTVIGHHSRFGNFSDIQGYCKIGNYVSGHSNVTVGQMSVIEDYAWLHPYVILINDYYPPTALEVKGPRIGKYSVVGAGSMIFPGVRLGKHVIVGAQSVVKEDIAEYQLVTGNPAKPAADSRRVIAGIKGKMVRPYPWMQHRKAGYPWEKEKGFEF